MKYSCNLNAQTISYGIQPLNDNTVNGVTTLESPNHDIRVFNEYESLNCTYSDMPSTTEPEWDLNDASKHCLQSFHVLTNVNAQFEALGIDFNTITCDCGWLDNDAQSNLYCEQFPYANIGLSHPSADITFALHDVAAHELSHTYLFQYIDLSNFTGGVALHEGTCDIIGTYIESLIEGLDWVIGDNNYGAETATDVDLSEETCWDDYNYAFNADEAGKSIGHWFYLISEGRPDPDPAKNIVGLGLEDAFMIVLDAIPLVGFRGGIEEYSQATLDVVADVYGLCSTEFQFQSVVNAWKDVCVLPYTCGEKVLVNPNVQDLVDLLCLGSSLELYDASGEVNKIGTFTVDEDIRLSDGLNFYMSEGSSIEIQEGIFFGKTGGFILPCENEEWNHIRSNEGQLYLYDVVISGAPNPILCDGGSGDIITCDIDDCLVGIRMSGSNGLFISHNDIDADHTAIWAEHGSSFVAQTNIIGAAAPVVKGIKLDHASDGLIYYNTIFSDYRGIETVYSLADINLNTVYNHGNAGISLFESSVLVNENIVDGTGHSGIYFNANADGMASFNRVDGDFNRMIQLQATQSHNIYANDVSGPGNNGIYNTNSSGNTYECNDLSGPETYGMFNGSNSVDQFIRTNEFSGSADFDFYSISEFGKQELTGNKDWCNAQATGFTQQISGFWVSDLTPDCDETPADYTPGLLNDDLSGNTPDFCGTTQGPGGIPSPEFICWWIDYISNLPPDKRNFFWVNSYHIIKRFMDEFPEHEWPECIWIFMLQQDCGLKELAEAEVEYMNALSESKAMIAGIRNQYDATLASEDRVNNEAYIQALKGARMTKEQTLRALREHQMSSLSTLPCEDEMFQLWRSVYLLRLKNQDDQLNVTDLDLTRQIAGLCASEYGDVVHWAMGLLSSYTTQLPETIDECEGESVEERNRPLMEEQVISTSMYPNPVSTELTLVLSGTAKGQVSLSDIRGQLILNSELTEGENRISVENLKNGIYLAKIIAVDFELTEMLIVTR